MTLKLLTIIESPFAGDVERNTLYLRRAVQDSLSRNETPFASHGFYTHFLNDDDPEDRDWGIRLGYTFWVFAKTIAFYMDYGMSSGMERAIEYYSLIADDDNPPEIQFRRIGLNA